MEELHIGMEKQALCEWPFSSYGAAFRNSMWTQSPKQNNRDPDSLSKDTFYLVTCFYSCIFFSEHFCEVFPHTKAPWSQNLTHFAAFLIINSEV